MNGAAVVLAAVLFVPAAAATTPGRDGLIAYADHGRLFTIRADGSAKRELGPGREPAWPSDGKARVLARWLRRQDGIALLRGLLDLVGDSQTSEWMDEARAHVDRAAEPAGVSAVRGSRRATSSRGVA